MKDRTKITIVCLVFATCCASLTFGIIKAFGATTLPSWAPPAPDGSSGVPKQVATNPASPFLVSVSGTTIVFNATVPFDNEWQLLVGTQTLLAHSATVDDAKQSDKGVVLTALVTQPVCEPLTVVLVVDPSDDPGWTDRSEVYPAQTGCPPVTTTTTQITVPVTSTTIVQPPVEVRVFKSPATTTTTVPAIATQQLAATGFPAWDVLWVALGLIVLGVAVLLIWWGFSATDFTDSKK